VWQQTEPPHINKDPLPLNVVTSRQARQAPSTSQLKRLETIYNRHWLISVRELDAGCVPPDTKKQEWNLNIENAT